MKRTGNSKIAVVGWGRGMGHKGHMYLADAVIVTAHSMKADPYFFVSKTVGKDDPLMPEEKIKIYQSVFPQQATIFTPQGNLNQALEQLAQLKYDGVVLVVGADQKEAFKYLERPNKEGVPVYQSFGLKKLKVISRQETRSQYAREEGPRATPMREILMHPNATEEQKYQVWRRDMPEALSDQEVLDLMQKAEQRLMTSNQSKRKKVKEFFERTKPLLSNMTTEQKSKFAGLLESALNEFAPDEGGGARKFIPWPEFIEQLKQILQKDFSCKENIVKSTIKARFVPHDPMEFGPTMLYSYYETRAGGRNKGAISTRGSIQIGKYFTGGLFGQEEKRLLTSFNLLKGHPFERHFDLTFDNIYKIANIIQGNTQGALEFQPQKQVNEFAPTRNGGAGGDYLRVLASAWYNDTYNTGSLQKGIESQEDVERILQRGILCNDGKKRKYSIGYNSKFDGVDIQSDDHYEYADYDDAGNDIDSRTGKPWGPYDVVSFAGNELYESQLNEFAPTDDGDNGQEDMFFKYAKLWYNGNLEVQQRIEQTLAQAGWEIGPLESEEGGAFIVQTGDEDGDTYMGWSQEELEGLDESIKGKLAAAALAAATAGAHGVVLNPARPIGPATANRPAPTVANPNPAVNPLNPLNPSSPTYVAKPKPEDDSEKKKSKEVKESDDYLDE